MEQERRLFEEAQAALSEARSVLDVASEGKVDLSTEENTRVDALMEEHDTKHVEATELKRKRERDERILAASDGKGKREREEARGENKPQPGKDNAEGRAEATALAEGQNKAFASYLRRGVAGMPADEQRILQEGNEEDGGFLVPEDFQAALIKRIPGLAVIRSRANVGQTSRDVVTVPKITGGDDMYSSGVLVSWVGEITADDDGLTEPQFGSERIPINKMMAKTRLSKDLIMDSAVDVTSVVLELYAEAVAMAEDNAFINGSADGRPEGLLVNANVGNTNGDFSDLTPVNSADPLIDLIYAIAQQYRNQGVFIMRAATAAKVRKIKDANNNYIWAPGLQPGEPGLLLGYPAFSTEFMPADATNAVPIVFGDFKGYSIYDRTQMEVQRLDERYAEQGQIGFVLTRRLGGQVTRGFMIRKLTRTG